MHAAFAVMFTLVAVAAAAAVDSVPTLTAGRCGAGRDGVVDHYYVTTAAGLEAPVQQTTARVCYDDDGWVVSLSAADINATSTAGRCNDAVWEAGAVMEVFWAPVASVYDAPVHYYEMDTAPTGAVYASVMNNTKGNATACLLAACEAGPLPCTGVATFPSGPTSLAGATAGGWAVTLRVPWTMFPVAYRPAGDGTPHPHWRGNLYRYDYPHGGAYELSGWSPTHDPSFHVPARFGRIVAV